MCITGTKTCLTILFLLVVAVNVGAQGLEVERYFSKSNNVYSIDYRDGLLAWGTPRDVFVSFDNKVMSAPIPKKLGYYDRYEIAVANADTLYLGPLVGSLPEASFYLADIGPEGISFVDITGAQNHSSACQLVASGPDGSLWIADHEGLKRFNGMEWESFPKPFLRYSLTWGQLCVSESGAVWGTDEWGMIVFRFQDGEWAFFEQLPGGGALGMAPDGTVWCATSGDSWMGGPHFPGLFRFDGDHWEKVSDDPGWERDNWSGEIQFDSSDRLWVMGPSSVALWDGQHLSVFRNACGVDLSDRVCSIEIVSDSAVLVGTHGYGMFIRDCGNTGWLRFSDSSPSDDIFAVVEDLRGAIWTLPRDVRLPGILDDGDWDTLHLPWLHDHMSGRTRFETDTDGALWLGTKQGAVKIIGLDPRTYDAQNSPLTSACSIAVDAQGTKWFAQGDKGPVFSFDDEAWVGYDPSIIGSNGPFEVFVCADDAKWFRHDSGYVKFDGETWTLLDFGAELPSLGELNLWTMQPCSDLTGTTLLYGFHGVYRGEPGSHWERVFDEGVTDLRFDSAGTMWLGTDGDIVYGNPGNWRQMCVEDGLSTGQISSIVIDHNGDKWVGKSIGHDHSHEGGLNHIIDGGPAQQKLELSVEEDAGGYLTVNGTFTNAGAVIPVLLWLAREHNGSLYYYPTWGPTPEGTKRVLGAYSVETEELLRLDTSTLPSGDYTFYGAISLLGGIDLLIGARDNKIAIATYHQ